jgi:hypothetical protein
MILERREALEKQTKKVHHRRSAVVAAEEDDAGDDEANNFLEQSTPILPPEALKRIRGQNDELYRQTLEIWWEESGRWYRGIVGKRLPDGSHLVHYVDGDKGREWLTSVGPMGKKDIWRWPTK